jgi:RhtB (resistance to homoserine/threonine) family protein
MIAQFFSIGLIALLGAMLPGPDFAIVTKNSLLHSRKSGYFTSLGIGSAIFIHMSYCVLGLAFIISSSPLVFSLIKYIGACYLIYLGLNSLLFKQKEMKPPKNAKKTEITNFASFQQGFLCNLLNPKATLFFLSLFTVVIKPETPFTWEVMYAIEIIFIATIWFCCLTVILSHSFIKSVLEKSEVYIATFLGIFLIGFGIALSFVGQ